MELLLKIAVAPLNLDLHPLSVYWYQQGFLHRIVEDKGEQVIYAQHETDVDRLRSDYLQFKRGELKLTLSKKRRDGQSGLFQKAKQFPITLALLILSLLGFALVELEFDTLVDLLVIQGIDRTAVPALLNLTPRISTAEYLEHGHYWRLFTPVFLHFGWVHITFNMLWLWELGRRIEIHAGSAHFLCVVFVVGIASNLYQAESTPYAFFGGMSGVIYGLLGYCWIFNLIVPSKNFYLPRSIYVLMLASLLAGYLGVFDFLARMANTAHLSGLIIGLIMGLSSALVYRFLPLRSNN